MCPPHFKKLTKWTGNLTRIDAPTVTEYLTSATPPIYHPRDTVGTSKHTTKTKPLYLSNQPLSLPGTFHFSISSYMILWHIISFKTRFWHFYFAFMCSSFVVTVPAPNDLAFSTRCFVFKKVHHRWGTDLPTGAGYSLCFTGGNTSAQCIAHYFTAQLLSVVCCQHSHLLVFQQKYTWAQTQRKT